jgi:RNA-directed DNA polymerase
LRMRKVFIHSYDSIISIENLLLAWQEFLKGKKNRKDVQEFEQRLMKNIVELHLDLKNKAYNHSEYEAFNISDPKPRNIHKASVRDRLLHHAIYRILYPFFNNTFIADSYSCRLGKGLHKALDRFQKYGYKVSVNHTKTAWVLKCDIRKFFATIDHQVLKDILRKRIRDKDILCLLSEIIESFCINNQKRGLPLGNLTSQLLVNIYMNEFDQFVKQKLKVKFYIRYADDFVFLSQNREYLISLFPKIREFLLSELKLALHSDKMKIQTIASGVDFLGWVHFSDHRVLRNITKRRMFSNLLKEEVKQESIQSYLGLLSHGNTNKIKEKILKVPYPMEYGNKTH